MSKIFGERECLYISEFLRVLSNPLRVKIICALMEKEKYVGEILKRVPAKQANLSQQLGILYMAGILKRRKQGKRVYYSLKSRKIRKLFETVRQVVLE